MDNYRLLGYQMNGNYDKSINDEKGYSIPYKFTAWRCDVVVVVGVMSYIGGRCDVVISGSKYSILNIINVIIELIINAGYART